MHNPRSPEAACGAIGHPRGVELSLFEEVGELTRTLVAAELGTLRFRSHRRGVKVWFRTERAGRFHYEAQLVPRHLVDAHDGGALEIGFHAEHGDADRNDRVVAGIVAAESSWREELGDAAEIGPFLGRPEDWRRISEVWLDPDLDDPELSFEVAARLADYVNLLEPHVDAGADD